MENTRALMKRENDNNPDLTEEQRKRLLGMLHPWNLDLYKNMSTQQKIAFLRLRTKGQLHVFTLEHAAIVGCAERIDLLWQRLEEMVQCEFGDEEDIPVPFGEDGTRILCDALDLCFRRAPKFIRAWTSRSPMLTIHPQEGVHHIVDITIVYGNCPECYAAYPLGFSCKKCPNNPRAKIIYFTKDEKDLKETRPLRPANPTELASHVGFMSVPKYLDHAFFIDNRNGDCNYTEDVEGMAINKSLNSLYVKLNAVTDTTNVFLTDRFESRIEAITHATPQTIRDTTDNMKHLFTTDGWGDVKHCRKNPMQWNAGDSSSDEDEAEENDDE